MSVAAELSLKQTWIGFPFSVSFKVWYGPLKAYCVLGLTKTRCRAEFPIGSWGREGRGRDVSSPPIVPSNIVLMFLLNPDCKLSGAVACF